ncbi:hypothetical protein SPFM15_00063 [Salmonella phage SPFM15]|nr:hypothetical protein SPFM5_00058 [Salmonella phage SPFM5]VFR13687.1 hypothetical protein SPFM15_00063 [Salmonella phage SPFM15]
MVVNRDEYKEMYMGEFTTMLRHQMMIKMSGPEAGPLKEAWEHLKTDEVIDKVGKAFDEMKDIDDEDIEDGFLQSKMGRFSLELNIAVNEVHQLAQRIACFEYNLIPKNIDRQHLAGLISAAYDEFREIFPAALFEFKRKCEDLPR